MVWTREDLHGMLGSPTYDWDLNGESNLTTYLDHNPSSLNSAAKIEFWIVFTNYHTHTHTHKNRFCCKQCSVTSHPSLIGKSL